MFQNDDEKSSTSLHSLRKSYKYAKSTYKVGKIIIKKVLLSKLGIIIIGVFLMIFLVLSPFIAIFDFAASGDLDGSGDISKIDQDIQKKYQAAAKRANPKVRSDSAEENKYLLKWGMIYAVDVFSRESGAPPIVKNTDNSNYKYKPDIENELPYNDLDLMAEKLAPKFSYQTGKTTIKTVTKEKVKKVNPDGSIAFVTQTKTDVKTQKVILLKSADTVQGTYQYTYEDQTTKSKRGNSTVTITTPVVSKVDYKKDNSRLDNIIKEYTRTDKVTDDNREMVIELARTAGIGDSDLGFLIDEPLLVNTNVAGIDISSLPEEWGKAFITAGKKYNVDYSILIAIAFVESSFNPNAVGPPNPSGELARGMMQFLPSTWSVFGVDGDGDGKADIFNPIDAIYTAAHYLHYLQIDKDPEEALYHYSGGSHAYAQRVLGLARSIAVNGANGEYMWPVPTSTTISSPFGVRINPIDGTKEYHKGIDIAAPCGIPIYAASSGKVIASGPASGFGDWIVIDTGGGVTNIYGHMFAKDLLVSVGNRVKKGQLISRVGKNGEATGCHLHFQIEVNGTPVNPLNYLNVSF
jgi:murein DD-endopeptidase MepM/ murein hydrolase activator NlpD